jgi:hypothetical protein
MEFRFTFIDKDGQDEQSVCRGNNLMDALFSFYELEGMRNITLIERIY